MYDRSQYSTLASVGNSQIQQQLRQHEWFPSTVEGLLEAEHDDYFVPKMAKCTMAVFLAEFSVVTNMYIKLKTILETGNDFNVNYLTISNGPLKQVLFRLYLKHFPIPPRILRQWMHMLADSGLIQFWIGWDNRLVYWNYYMESAKDTSSKPRKISLKGNIGAIFLLMLGFIWTIWIPALAIERISGVRNSRIREMTESDGAKILTNSHTITTPSTTGKHPLTKSASDPSLDQITAAEEPRRRAKSGNIFHKQHHSTMC